MAYGNFAGTIEMVGFCVMGQSHVVEATTTTAPPASGVWMKEQPPPATLQKRRDLGKESLLLTDQVSKSTIEKVVRSTEKGNGRSRREMRVAFTANLTIVTLYKSFYCHRYL